MASLVLVPATSLGCSTSTSKKTPPFIPSVSSSLIPQLGLGPFSQWSGLKHLGISITPISLKKAWKGKCEGRMVVHASLFGVGAPEALVIGVVALLVFGPKGLAEVARNLGKTLRAFQPTIRELQEVSREFKNTLEREIGLDEIPNPTQNTSSSRTNIAPNQPSAGSAEKAVSDVNGVSSSKRAYTSEEYLKVTEEQLKASAAQQQQQPQSASIDTQPEAAAKEAVGAVPPPTEPEKEV